jgi:hypothetical protein
MLSLRLGVHRAVTVFPGSWVIGCDDRGQAVGQRDVERSVRSDQVAFERDDVRPVAQPAHYLASQLIMVHCPWRIAWRSVCSDLRLVTVSDQLPRQPPFLVAATGR